MSPSIHQLNLLLSLCGSYAEKWKLEFGINKCNWMVFGNVIYEDAMFTLNGQIIHKIENVIHLGLPIGDKAFTDNFIKDKFKKVERSFNSLYAMGCRHFLHFLPE